jgi:hypothetical protein
MDTTAKTVIKPVGNGLQLIEYLNTVEILDEWRNRHRFDGRHRARISGILGR